MTTSGKFQSEYNSKLFKKTVLLSVHLQNCPWLPLEKQIFGAKMAISGKFQLAYNLTPLKKQVLL